MQILDGSVSKCRRTATDPASDRHRQLIKGRAWVKGKLYLFRTFQKTSSPGIDGERWGSGARSAAARPLEPVVIFL